MTSPVRTAPASDCAALEQALRSLGAPLRPKTDALLARLRRLDSALIAYSGGVDSALVARMARLVLGRDRVLAVTARSPSLPQAEHQAAADLAVQMDVAHEFIETSEFADERYLANPANRCFFCKSELYRRLAPLARQRGLAAVVNGVNADDLGDFRPGLTAAAQHAVVAPLAECGVTKAELRQMAAAVGLPIHDKPASPCLSSRVQYGERITPEKLRRIDAAEEFLRSLGFRVCRVRHHEDLARIEVPLADLDRVLEAQTRAAIDAKLRELGYRYVTVDLRGFRSGSLNEALLGRGFDAARPRLNA